MNAVVLGMHRSGTSLLIGLLELHGFRLGEVSNQTSQLKPTGTKENLALRKLNNSLFKTADSNWKNPKIPSVLPKSIIDDIKNQIHLLSQLKNWALKDPRMVFTYSVWQPYLPTHKVIGTIRNPISVALSLNKKNGIDIYEGLEIWYRYNSQLMSLWQKIQFPMVVFGASKEHYFSQVARVFESLGLTFNHEKASGFYQHIQSDQECELSAPSHVEDLYNCWQSVISS